LFINLTGIFSKKKGIDRKLFKEKEKGKEAATKKEKILDKLMNKHDCSREEASFHMLDISGNAFFIHDKTW
jgi:hypothetical protein